MSTRSRISEMTSSGSKRSPHCVEPPRNARSVGGVPWRVKPRCRTVRALARSGAPRAGIGSRIGTVSAESSRPQCASARRRPGIRRAAMSTRCARCSRPSSWSRRPRSRSAGRAGLAAWPSTCRCWSARCSCGPRCTWRSASRTGSRATACASAACSSRPSRRRPGGFAAAARPAARAAPRRAARAARARGGAGAWPPIVFPPFVVGFYLWHAPEPRVRAAAARRARVVPADASCWSWRCPRRRCSAATCRAGSSERLHAPACACSASRCRRPRSLLQALLFALIHFAVDLNPDAAGGVLPGAAVRLAARAARRHRRGRRAARAVQPALRRARPQLAVAAAARRGCACYPSRVSIPRPTLAAHRRASRSRKTSAAAT